LPALRRRRRAIVRRVAEPEPNDPISARLRDLGFVAGEFLEVVARAPFGGDPLFVEIGATRFALHVREAARIIVEPLTGVTAVLDPGLRVALVGNPNSGKTSLFNLLTGSRQKTANYPGVTVKRKEGRFAASSGIEVTLVDLPGVYSPAPDEPR
jgi:Fe2+ transport system protein FeoA